MRKLYKQFPEYNKGYLKVSKLHKIYYEESGNPKGKPVVVLHGGPGSKSKPKKRKFFNPKKWRVVMFDQRGCGKSKPAGEIGDNTTWDLVDDIEKLRNHLGIKKWAVYGRSWGSTLGLVYAQEHPKSITSLILGGIWLCRKRDIKWLMAGGELKRLFPELWEERLRNLKKLGIAGGSINKQLYEKLVSGTKREQKLTCLIFKNWEEQFYDIDNEIHLYKEADVDEKEILSNKILMHYVINDCFIRPNQILKNIIKLPRVPTVIIQGRYDMICPVEQAWELQKSIKGSILEILPLAGHHASEVQTTQQILKYTDKFAELK